MRERWSLENSL